MLCRKALKRSVCLTVELHKYEVPDLDNLRMTCIYHITTRDLCNLRLVTKVEVNLATRTARTCLAHLPEIIVLVTTDNVVLRQILLPIVVSLLVEWHTVRLRALEYCCIHSRLIESVNLSQKLPSPADSLLLEIVAERPVSEHLKHCVVVCIVTYLLQVVVLTRYTQTLLRVGCTRSTTRGIAKEDILKLIHTRIGKHQCRVVLYHHRCRWNNLVLFCSEKVQKCLSNFV